MPVNEGTGDRDFTSEVRHVTNGDLGDQNTFRAASVDLEKRTNALVDFSNALETFVYALLGNDDSSVSGVQGNINANHNHNGIGDTLIDNQVVYNNGDADAVLSLATNGSYTMNLAVGSSFTIVASDATPLLTVDNDTKVTTIHVP